jgi:hypothetical protein
MPSDYTGNPAGITAREVPVISCPVGTDAPVAASVNTPLKKLADILARLQDKAADIGVENDFTDANPLKFMRSGDQTLTKDVAGLLFIRNLVHGIRIEAVAGHNAELSSAGSASIEAMPGEVHVNGFPIGGVADPRNGEAQDVVTQNWATNHAVPSAIISASCDIFIPTGSGSMTAITNLTSGSFATNGRPVSCSMQPDGAHAASIAIASGATLDIRLMMDGTEIARWQWYNSAAAPFTLADQPHFIHTPSNAAHTYSFEASYSGTAGSSIAYFAAAFALV